MSVLAGCLIGCTQMYTLPDPPPKEEWVAAEEKVENPEDVAQRAINAKRAAIQCYAALASKNWDKALGLMSEATVSAFETASEGAGAIAVFENGVLTYEGEKTAFDPVGDVFITGLADIRDELEGRKDVENATRHVYYAVDANGNAHEIVFILENDQWVLDRPDIFAPLIKP